MSEAETKNSETRANEALGVYLHQMLATILRGAVSVTRADPRIIMLSMSRITGGVIGTHFGGDGTPESEEEVRKFREACSTQFSIGISQAPIPRVETTKTGS